MFLGNLGMCSTILKYDKISKGTDNDINIIYDLFIKHKHRKKFNYYAVKIQYIITKQNSD